MEFTLITVGLLFLMNPLIGILDILPDFLGCLIILLGINRLRAVSPELDDTVPIIKYMTWASLARTLTFFVSGGFDEITHLSITIIFAVIEFGLGAAMISALYNGLAYLNIRYDGKVKEAPEFRYIGAVFLAAKGLFSVIPQLGAIASESTDITENVTETWAAFSGLLNVSNVFLTLVFAIFWGYTVLNYIGRMARDKNFCSLIRQEYNIKRETVPNLFIRRTLIFGFSCLTASAFFLIDFIGDGKNYIPDFIFGAASLFGIYVISKYTKVRRPVFISGGIYTAISLVDHVYYNSIMEKRFYASIRLLFQQSEIGRQFLTEYIFLIIFAVLSATALIIYLCYIYGFLKNVLQDHVVCDFSEEYVKSNKLNQLQVNKIRKFIKVFFVLGIISAASSVAFSSLILIWSEIWMINLAVNIAVFCYASALFTKFKEGVIEKYELETDA